MPKSCLMQKQIRRNRELRYERITIAVNSFRCPIRRSQLNPTLLPIHGVNKVGRKPLRMSKHDTK